MSPVGIDSAALNELYLSCLCTWREMRGASEAERLGCYWVQKNRVNDTAHRWPRSIVGVVTQRWQFSSFNATDPNAAKWPKPDGSADWQAWLDIVTLIQSGQADNTGGANQYENRPAGATRPSWADPAKMTKAIGSTRFYKL